ncbi:hypothetical protein TASIC1_0016005900 [Trichoderma asperellum]|uniref:Uncharacterized protein n=1 Tax=Trichoderma asperellum TaxID=101201 RepID=A0A6V8R528_TRIAP|nr:hypothetical protein TASIC1_0016005900 [Trichoderma asperellum]
MAVDSRALCELGKQTELLHCYLLGICYYKDGQTKRVCGDAGCREYNTCFMHRDDGQATPCSGLRPDSRPSSRPSMRLFPPKRVVAAVCLSSPSLSTAHEAICVITWKRYLGGIIRALAREKGTCDQPLTPFPGYC